MRELFIKEFNFLELAIVATIGYLVGVGTALGLLYGLWRMFT